MIHVMLSQLTEGVSTNGEKVIEDLRSTLKEVEKERYMLAKNIILVMLTDLYKRGSTQSDRDSHT